MNENARMSHAFIKLPVEMPRPTSLFLFTVARKPSSVLSFFRGTGGKSPDLSSQKKETLRGADSAYYQVGQMGKEGAENQGAEPQGTRQLSPSSVLGLLLLPNLIHTSKAQNAFLLILFQWSKITQHVLIMNYLSIKCGFLLKTLLCFMRRKIGSFKPQ